MFLSPLLQSAQAIEECGETLRKDGSLKEWWLSWFPSACQCALLGLVCAVCRQQGMADVHVAQISEGVHGPLLKALAERAGYHDVDAVELFRTGAPIVGRLDR